MIPTVLSLLSTPKAWHRKEFPADSTWAEHWSMQVCIRQRVEMVPKPAQVICELGVALS
jgi:hypothetical protein